MASNPILISGAGLGGLLLARSLKNNNIPFLLYERDESIAARAQGYRIRISTDGLNALKEVLTDAQFEKFISGTATTGQGGMHTLDAISGNEGSAKGPTGGNSSKPKLGGDVLGVARGWLRKCLFEDMEGAVHWAKRSIGFSINDGSVTLKFADGSTSPEGSLLIAADGPQSMVTKQLTEGKVRAYDTGARMIHGQSPSHAFKQLGYGVWSVQDTSAGPEGSRIGFITNVNPSIDLDGNDDVGWVFVGGPGTFDAPGGDFSVTGKVAADLSRNLTTKWHSKFQPIFREQQDAEAAFLKMSTARPEGVPHWTNSPQVTILGDAVHCMTPAGGVGANTALRDAALLGKLLGQAGGWREGLTSEYEQEMRIYASENVKMSFNIVEKQFNIVELK